MSNLAIMAEHILPLVIFHFNAHESYGTGVEIPVHYEGYIAPVHYEGCLAEYPGCTSQTQTQAQTSTGPGTA